MHYHNSYLFICFLMIGFVFSGNALGNECYRSAKADTPSHHFKNLGQGIVADTRSGLTWMRCPIGMRWNNDHCLNVPDRASWSDAKIAIIRLNEEGGYAGFRDWRLPNLEELSTLIESKCYEPAINSAIFPDTPSTGFWTTTEDIYNRQGAWLVYFLNGKPYMGNWDYEWAIRAVRK